MTWSSDSLSDLDRRAWEDFQRPEKTRKKRCRKPPPKFRKTLRPGNYKLSPREKRQTMEALNNVNPAGLSDQDWHREQSVRLAAARSERAMVHAAEQEAVRNGEPQP
jgi:hypothetical protein